MLVSNYQRLRHIFGHQAIKYIEPVRWRYNLNFFKNI